MAKPADGLLRPNGGRFAIAIMEAVSRRVERLAFSDQTFEGPGALRDEEAREEGEGEDTGALGSTKVF